MDPAGTTTGGTGDGSAGAPGATLPIAGLTGSGSGRRTTAAPAESPGGVIGSGSLAGVHADKASANSKTPCARCRLIVTSSIGRIVVARHQDNTSTPPASSILYRTKNALVRCRSSVQLLQRAFRGMAFAPGQHPAASNACRNRVYFF